jgi:glyoxylase I family protein
MPEVPTRSPALPSLADGAVRRNESLFEAEMFLDESLGPFRRAVWLVGGQTLVGFHQFSESADGAAFDERRIGLDHLAFGCSSRGQLEAWELRLEELGIANGGIVDADYGSGLSFRDPDNIALEFFAPSS